MMETCLMTALAKLLFVSPAEVRPVLAQALSLDVRDGHPAVWSKALFLYTLLKTNIDTARSALLSTKSNMEPFVEDTDAENVDMVFDVFTTFSVIYDAAGEAAT
jgi:CTP:molybdopterin cytidylyltransferase MocA